MHTMHEILHLSTAGVLRIISTQTYCMLKYPLKNAPVCLPVWLCLQKQRHWLKRYFAHLILPDMYYENMTTIIHSCQFWSWLSEFLLKLQWYDKCCAQNIDVLARVMKFKYTFNTHLFTAETWTLGARFSDPMTHPLCIVEWYFLSHSSLESHWAVT